MQEQEARDPEAASPPSQQTTALQQSLQDFVRQLDSLMLEVRH